MSYQPLRSSRSTFIDIRGLRYHVREWGDAAAPKLVLLHGWMDIAASWQFMVDALSRDWHVIAPDWRGFGRSQWDEQGYWFPDYYADLDALLDLYSPDTPVNLAGHSMGGNVACIYAGVRPHRIARLVSMEGFGMPATDPADAPERIAKWLDEWHPADSARPSLRPYASLDELAARIASGSPRLDLAQALFLAREHAIERNGQVEFSSDPRHKGTNPVLFRIEEARACWRRITAPTLWLLGDESDLVKRFYGADGGEVAARAACFSRIETRMLRGAGHMMQHDQPRELAEAVETFLLRP
jgi:pimeloyl-ACP methyl ester carboxylesterase